jgi:hypothetical protein
LEAIHQGFPLQCRSGRRLAKVSAALASTITIHTGVVVPYLIELCTDVQKTRSLPRSCTGELVTAMAMTEPPRGSDLGVLRTTATPATPFLCPHGAWHGVGCRKDRSAELDDRGITSSAVAALTRAFPPAHQQPGSVARDADLAVALFALLCLLDALERGHVLLKGHGGTLAAGLHQPVIDPDVTCARPEVNLIGAERIAARWGASAATTWKPSRSKVTLAPPRRIGAPDKDEIVAIDNCESDEGIHRDSSRERPASLKTLREGGTITAGVASQISDGSAALPIASEAAIRAHRLAPLARVHSMTVEGSDPLLMPTTPILAHRKLLQPCGLSIDDIDRFEVNEAFASVVLAWAKRSTLPLHLTNESIGAIALGHPLGATGARPMTSLVHELRATSTRYGVQTMCEVGGMANAIIFEAL